MAIAHHVLTLNGSAQALATITGSTTKAIRTVTLQPGTANSEAVYVGASGVTTSDYGVRIPASVAGVPPPPLMLGETQSQYGHFKLSDVYVIGTSDETLHLLVVTVD